jgi:hypothetical protein
MNRQDTFIKNNQSINQLNARKMSKLTQELERPREWVSMASLICHDKLFALWKPKSTQKFPRDLPFFQTTPRMVAC